MKKHFLLLVMAFFSLAGWAQTVTPEEVVINFSPAVYGGGAPNMEVSYAGNIRTVNAGEGTDFTWDGKYYTNEACTTEAETLAVSANNYYVKVVGAAGTIFQGVEKVGYFKVEQAVLTIKAVADQEYEFGDEVNLSTTTEKIEFEGFIEGEDADDLTVSATGLTIVCGTITNAGVYPITDITGLSAQNYKIVYANTAVVKINPLQLDAINAVIDGAVEGETYSFTYNAQTQTPTYIVSYGEGDDEVVLTEGTDFEIVYGTVAGALAEGETPINAAEYTATVVGKGNYSIGEENAGLVAPGFEIEKAQVNVTAIAKTKVYDGEAFDLNEAQISINGLVNNEIVTGCLAVYADELEDHSGAATYPVTVDAGDAVIGEVALATNYAVNAIPSNWTISKRPVNLTLSDITKVLGTALADVLAGEEIAENNVEAAIYEEEELINNRGALADDVAGIAEAYELALDADVMEGVATLALGTYTDAITATIEEAFANYDITVVPADLIVSGKDFVVYPVVPANIQYGDSYTIGYNAYVAGEGGAYLSGATIDDSKLVFVIGDEEFAYNAEGIEGLPTDLGNYVVTIKAGTAVGSGDNASGAATTMAGNFAIGKKILNVTVGDLVVHAGDPITIIEKAGVTFAGDKQDYDVELTYALTEETAANVELDDDDIITGLAEGEDEAKITVAFAEGFESDYYELGEVAYGTLTLSDDYVLVLGGENTKQDIETAETNGSENVVAIFEEGAISMKAEEWYAMVLPFNTSAKELVNVLNTYVVVNTLSTSSTDQNYKFKLEMGDIPAGKPFIIKPAEAIDWGAAIPVYYAEGDDIPEGSAVGDVKEYASVVFFGKTIVSEITPYGAEGIVNIYGTYESQILGVDGYPAGEGADITDRSWWLSDTDYEATKIANDWRKPKNNPHTLAPMEAYLVAADGWTTYAPVFTVEDFDGQTTAIKTLNADKINGLNVSEGWYNLNGMKMQGAPTQKGVYINNGKKVIIK